MASQVPAVTAFFHEPTKTVSYLAADTGARRAAIIDPALDFDLKTGVTWTASADRVAAAVREGGLTVDWIIETHVHADHLSAAAHLRAALGGKVAIGAAIGAVQRQFAPVYNLGADFACDGSQFDHLFADGETFQVGSIPGRAIHTPGHTPACTSYLIGDAVFVGDTMFMPDFGTARCDFPGGDAAQLYRSIRRLLELPDETRVFVGHDYAPGGRPYAWETTIGEERRTNKHVRDGVEESSFVAWRTGRDATLGLPDLIVPALQVNLRAGRLPPEEGNGISYLKIPIGAFPGARAPAAE